MHRLRHRRPFVPQDAEPPFDRAAAMTLAHVAHELKQPLSAVLSAFHVIRCSKQSRQREHAAVVIDRQLHRLSRLIDDLLEATRLQVHRPSLEVARVDLRQLTTEVVDALRPEATAKRQHLSLSMPPEAVIVTVDWMRMQQVLSNLVTNAIKYTHVGGLVHVSLGNHKTEAVLAVTDTGQGIAREILPRVFDAFVQGHAHKHGLGLGLAVARRFVTLHGGSIRAESAGPGKGSTFVVRLPIPGVTRLSSRSVHAAAS